VAQVGFSFRPESPHTLPRIVSTLNCVPGRPSLATFAALATLLVRPTLLYPARCPSLVHFRRSRVLSTRSFLLCDSPLASSSLCLVSSSPQVLIRSVHLYSPPPVPDIPLGLFSYINTLCDTASKIIDTANASTTNSRQLAASYPTVDSHSLNVPYHFFLDLTV
jgi:hypothetical protein